MDSKGRDAMIRDMDVRRARSDIHADGARSEPKRIEKAAEAADRIFTRDEAVCYLRLDAVGGNPLPAIYHLVHTGQLAHLKYRGRLFFRQSHLDSFLDSRECKDVRSR